MCLIASVVFPLWISSLRLSVTTPGYSLNSNKSNGNSNCLKRCIIFIFDQLLSLIHPVLLQCQLIVLEREYVKIVNMNDKSKNEAFLQIIQKRKKLDYQMKIFKKLELNIETIFQLCGQFLLLLLAESETRTLQAFTALFKQSDIEISDISKKDWMKQNNYINLQEGKFIIPAHTFVIISVLFSIFTFTYSQSGGVAGHRVYFPIKSKITIGFSALMACVTRVTSMVLYFSPVMGLWNLTRHLHGKNSLK